MSLYERLVPALTRALDNVPSWLDAAEEHARAKKYDPNTLLSARLAPDQFALVRQLQAICDQAKFAVARVAAKAPPKHPDTETTFAEFRARIADVRQYVASFTPADFEGAEGRTIPLGSAPGKGMAAADYVREYLLPNFYFHYGMAYAILRHNGVDVGKRHFLGPLTTRDL